MAFNPPLVDNFTGPNGSVDGRVATPQGGIWVAPHVNTHLAGQIASNAFAGSAGEDRDAVLQGAWGPDVQAAATISTLGSAIFLRVRIQQTVFPVAPADRDYYSVRVTIVGAANDTLVLTRSIANVSTTRATWDIGGEWGAGDGFGLELIEVSGGTQATGYRKPSGGSWGSVGSVLETTAGRPIGAGAIALEIDSTNGAVDDLSAHTLNVATLAWLTA